MTQRLPAKSADIDERTVTNGAERGCYCCGLKRIPVGGAHGVVVQRVSPRKRIPNSMPLPPMAAISLADVCSFQAAQAIQMPERTRVCPDVGRYPRGRV